MTIETTGSPPQRPSQRLPLLVLTALVTALVVAAAAQGWRLAALAGVGVLLGASLQHAQFGFASGYRKLLVHGDGRGVLAQLALLALVTILFTPLLLSGVARGAVAPVALQAAVGATLFGVGMQLGSGCACGTLYAIGGGSGLMLFTLASFAGGSFLATLTAGLWQGLPRLEPQSLLVHWGWAGALLQLLVLAALALLLLGRQRSASSATASTVATAATASTVATAAPGAIAAPWAFLSPRSSLPSGRPSLRQLGRTLLVGPWSPLGGALALALLSGVTLLLAGRPWGVTWGFTLWAAKLAHLVGWDPSTSALWRQETFARALHAGLLEDITSVMNLGIVLGAAAAAAAAGQWRLRPPASFRAVAASLVGGLLMGYGAWLSFGCNVGAYLAGIGSTSLHGWLWIGFALLGTALGVRLRPRFGLAN
jgi:uncharacterized membrane protein YedE/YeeE